MQPSREEKRGTLVNRTKEEIQKAKFLRGKAALEEGEIYEMITDYLKLVLDVEKELSTDELHDKLDKTFLEPKTKRKAKELLEYVEIIEYYDDAYGSDELRSIVSLYYRFLQDMQDEKNLLTERPWWFSLKLWLKDHTPFFSDV